MKNLLTYLKRLVGIKEPQYKELWVCPTLREEVLSFLADGLVRKYMPDGFEGEMPRLTEEQANNLREYGCFIRSRSIKVRV